MTIKNTVCLWFDGTAEQAARFHAATLPSSVVQEAYRASADYPSGKQGDVLTVLFTVTGIPCLGQESACGRCKDQWRDLMADQAAGADRRHRRPRP